MENSGLLVDSGKITGKIMPGINSISDGSKRWETDILQGMLLYICSKNASGGTVSELKYISGNSAQTLVVNSNFATVLETGSTYMVLDANSPDLTALLALLTTVDGKIDVVDTEVGVINGKVDIIDTNVDDIEALLTTGSVIVPGQSVPQDLSDIFDKVTQIQGLVYYGVVTTYTDANNFETTDITGFGDDFFVGWRVNCLWDGGGAGAAPQGEYALCTNYVSATGAFTHNAFSAILAEDDKVLLIHPVLYEILTIKGGAHTIEDIWDNQMAQLDRAIQTNEFTCDGNENDIYNEDGGGEPFDFDCGWIDFTGANAGAGENTTINIYTTDEAGNERLVWTAVYLAAGVPSPARVQIPNSDDGCDIKLPLHNISGVRITEQQALVGGGWNTLYGEFYDSKVGG